MEWTERLNEAITYMEEHMQEEISLEEVAKIACTFPYNLQRMFFYMTGISLPEYIRRRRMSLAVEELQQGTDKIIDIALRYQYASPTAFNQAFRSVYGIVPSQVCNVQTAVRLYLPLHFQLSTAGSRELNYRIVKKDALRVVGVCHELEKELEKNYKVVPNLWRTAAEDGMIVDLSAYIDAKEPSGLLGISTRQDSKDWKLWIGMVSEEPLNGYEELQLPKASWIISRYEGTHASIQELERRIRTEWSLSTGYQYVNGSVMEVYLDSDPSFSRLEMWLMTTDM